ncbi:MAG: nucleotidyltransferase domain-containing protein [Methylomonas sp.]|nr:nucleotidyltransferase domain-containing protein [Methylomonas sp.]
MSFGLTEQTLQSMWQVFRQYPEIDQVLIYGSRAKGNFRKGSDIDLSLLGIELSEKLLSAVARQLDELNMPYLIDISIYDQLQSAELKSHIDRMGQIFYRKD